MRTTKGELPVLIGEGMTEEELELPPSYYLDEADPDVVLLRRQDGTFVAAFSAQGATREDIVEAAKEDYGQLVGTYAAKQGQSSAGQRGRQSALPWNAP